ncbi:hypothetical protein L6452_17998 [Arctium lappa]|uniref:Uncharacterized protein n=1 Tax=Arctium lappa TaxID=4217 RepID=A0ACB9C584_ARCLA|nr:hypothetical protein L6452_17998 [Arctium lappa]
MCFFDRQSELNDFHKQRFLREHVKRGMNEIIIATRHLMIGDDRSSSFNEGEMELDWEDLTSLINFRIRHCHLSAFEVEAEVLFK